VLCVPGWEIHAQQGAVLVFFMPHWEVHAAPQLQQQANIRRCLSELLRLFDGGNRCKAVQHLLLCWVLWLRPEVLSNEDELHPITVTNTAAGSPQHDNATAYIANAFPSQLLPCVQ
jgi:hypothetical protein